MYEIYNKTQFCLTYTYNKGNRFFGQSQPGRSVLLIQETARTLTKMVAGEASLSQNPPRITLFTLEANVFRIQIRPWMRRHQVGTSNSKVHLLKAFWHLHKGRTLHCSKATQTHLSELLLSARAAKAEAADCSSPLKTFSSSHLSLQSLHRQRLCKVSQFFQNPLWSIKIPQLFHSFPCTLASHCHTIAPFLRPHAQGPAPILLREVHGLEGF